MIWVKTVDYRAFSRSGRSSGVPPGAAAGISDMSFRTWRRSTVAARRSAIHAVEECRECLILAKTYRPDHACPTVSLPLVPDIKVPMSGFRLIPSDSTPAPDIADTLRVRGLLTPTGHQALAEKRSNAWSVDPPFGVVALSQEAQALVSDHATEKVGQDRRQRRRRPRRPDL